MWNNEHMQLILALLSWEVVMYFQKYKYNHENGMQPTYLQYIKLKFFKREKNVGEEKI